MQSVQRQRKNSALTLSIFLFLAAFYMGFVYDWRLIQIFSVMKWIGLLALLSTLFFLYSNRLNQFAQKSLPLSLVALTGALVASSIGSPSLATSILYSCLSVCVLWSSWALASIAAQKGSLSIFTNPLVALLVVNVLACFAMWVLGVNLGRVGHEGRFTAWTDNPNSLAQILAPGLVFLFAMIRVKSKITIALISVFTLGVFVIGATGSRAGLLFVISGVGAYLFVAASRNRAIIFVFPMTLAAAAYLPILIERAITAFSRSDSATAGLLGGRGELWSLGSELFAERPVFGHGPGVSGELMLANSWQITRMTEHFHNSYISIAVEGGSVLLGLVLITIFGTLASAILYLFRVRRRRIGVDRSFAVAFGVFIGGLVHAGFETWMFSPGNPNMFVFWVCVFYILVVTSREFRGVNVGMHLR